MTSKIRIDLTIPSNSQTFYAKTLPMNSDGHRSFDGLSSYFASIAGGVYSGRAIETIGAVSSMGTLTITSTGPTATQTFTVANVTFTAETSDATGNQFNINASPTIVAANIAKAVNASPDTLGIVSATSSLGVVTFTATAPGAIGNGTELSAGNLSNTTASAFSGGVDGTVYNFSVGQA